MTNAEIRFKKMPSVRIQDNNFPEKSREVVYELGDETLESLVSKYDSYSTSENTRGAQLARV